VLNIKPNFILLSILSTTFVMVISGKEQFIMCTVY